MFLIPNRFFIVKILIKYEKQTTSSHCFINFTQKNSNLTFSRYFILILLVLFWLDIICGHSLKVFFEFYKYFDNKKAIGNQKHAFNSVKSKYMNLLKLRYLWTLPGRKTCMMSSSPSNTTSISNFKSISLTVVEFWKRYHQKLLNR